MRIKLSKKFISRNNEQKENLKISSSFNRQFWINSYKIFGKSTLSENFGYIYMKILENRELSILVKFCALGFLNFTNLHFKTLTGTNVNGSFDQRYHLIELQ